MEQVRGGRTFHYLLTMTKPERQTARGIYNAEIKERKRIWIPTHEISALQVILEVGFLCRVGQFRGFEGGFEMKGYVQLCLVIQLLHILGNSLIHSYNSL
uniref:Uncharacterized protein n=1 Tax=Salix viminalis TaxID=40686 RepID=A0A6N2KR80_SALVM